MSTEAAFFQFMRFKQEAVRTNSPSGAIAGCIAQASERLRGDIEA